MLQSIIIYANSPNTMLLIIFYYWTLFKNFIIYFRDYLSIKVDLIKETYEVIRKNKKIKKISYNLFKDNVKDKGLANVLKMLWLILI